MGTLSRVLLLLPAVPLSASTPNVSNTEVRRLLVTEREFREEVIYFIIVDRFHDSTSDEEERRGLWDRGSTPGLYDKTWTQWGKYWGGNLLGIIDKIPYLQSLGVTALWLSPLFEQVDDMQFDRAPMHGYWTKDFKRINPRFLPAGETNSIKRSPTLKLLIDSLHSAGIKLILDVVCNHSSPDINGQKGVVYDDGVLLCDYGNDAESFYYHNGEIADWEDEYQLINCEMCGLATFNERNPAFRNYIKSAISEWLDLGVDALRVDTLKHMPIWFWQEFTTDIKSHLPGIFLFGEYGFGKPWDIRTVEYANHSGMSILDFGLADAIRFAFSGTEPGGFHLVENLLAFDHVYHRANELVTFIDNHDMPRFLSIVPNPKSLEQALILLFSARGVPCVFYGTEQYLVNNTDGGNDPYNRPMMEAWDMSSSGYRLVSTLIAIRRANQALTFGSHRQIYISDDIYAFMRSYRDSHALCILNKGPDTSVMITLPEPFAGKQLICALDGSVHSSSLNSLSIYLNSGASHLFSLPGERVEGSVVATFQLNGLVTQPGQRIVLTGNCDELGNWDLAKSYGMEFVNRNTWICEVGFVASASKMIHFKYVLLDHRNEPVLYENIIPRQLLLPSEGREKIDSIWQQS